MGTAVDACRYCLRRENLRRTLLIAAIVGSLLTAINLGDTIVSGDATTSTWIRAGANFLVPFCVSNAGLLVGRPKPSPARSASRAEQAARADRVQGSCLADDG